MGLKKYLQQFSREQLIEQIVELNKKYKDVKTYYEFTLNPDGNIQADRVKKAIQKMFNPPFGQDPKLREARKEVNNFIKLSPTDGTIADMMLHYAECGVKYTSDYGDINEPFYNSVASMFNNACEFIMKNGLQNQFRERCKKLMDATRDFGWGFYDDLSNSYYEFFENNNP